MKSKHIIPTTLLASLICAMPSVNGATVVDLPFDPTGSGTDIIVNRTVDTSTPNELTYI
jgi:hypothetical protein